MGTAGLSGYHVSPALEEMKNGNQRRLNQAGKITIENKRIMKRAEIIETGMMLRVLIISPGLRLGRQSVS